MAFSRWVNNTEFNFENVINNISSLREWFEPSLDPLNNQQLPYRIAKTFETNQVIRLNDSNIYYNSFSFEYSKVRSGEENNPMYSSRIQNISSFIIVYSDGQNTQFIINKSSNMAKTILRKLNNHSGNNTVISSPYAITPDLFDWLIYTILEDRTTLSSEEPELELKKIVGFKGTTDDEGLKLAEIIGSGDRIMKAISTLAFLLESDEVEYVKPLLEYRNDHSIEISMRLNGTIDFNFEKYTGSFMMEPEFSLKTKVTLLSSLEIIPKLIAKYGESIEEESWGTNIKVEMLENIGNQIGTKVQEKVNSLRNE